MKRKCLWLFAAVVLTTANTAFAQNKDDTPEPPTIALTSAGSAVRPPMASTLSAEGK